MEKEEILELIKAIKKSIRENPTQFVFNVEVNFTGIKATAIGGGIGAQASNVGGTGFNISGPSNIDVSITNQAVNEKIQQEFQEAISLLEKFENAIREEPEKSKLMNILEEFKPNKILSGVISNIIAWAITKSF